MVLGMHFVRRLGWIAFAIAFVVAVVVPTSAGLTSPQPACEHSCGTTTAAANSEPAPNCTHDVRCAGGGALTSSSSFVLLGLAAATAVVAVVLVARRRVWNRSTPRFDTLLASRLFHPPRLLLAR